MKGNENSSHTGQEINVGGRTDKQTEKPFWRNNEQEISTVGGLRERVVSLMNLWKAGRHGLLCIFCHLGNNFCG